MPEWPVTTINVAPTDWATGIAQLNKYAAGQRVATKHDHMCAALVLSAQTEYLVQVTAARATDDIPADVNVNEWIWKQICLEGRCVLGDSRELADAVNLGDLYAATEQTIRDMRVQAQNVEGQALPPKLPEQMGAIPIAGWVAITLVGSAAAAGLAWFGSEVSEDYAEVSVEASRIAANLAAYQKQLDDAAARGLPQPGLPKGLQAAADEEDNTVYWAAGAGILLGGLLLYGIQQGLKTPRAQPARVANPKRRRRPRHSRIAAAGFPPGRRSAPPVARGPHRH